MTTKKKTLPPPADGWEAARQTQQQFDPDSVVGQRSRSLRERTARTLIAIYGQYEAYRQASTEERVIGVGLVHLANGGSAGSVAAGLADWLAAHPKPRKRNRTQRRSAPALGRPLDLPGI